MSEAKHDLEQDKESIGAYIGNVVLCMIFPFVVLWYGPKYLARGEYVKGIVIIGLVVTEVLIVLSMQGLI